MEDSLRLSQFLDHIRRVLSMNFAKPIWIIGEIAQQRASRGHLYIQLVEKETNADQAVAQADAVLWANKKSALELSLKEDLLLLLREGNEVRLLINVDFHKVYGLKLVVENIDLQYSMGQMALRRRQIIEALREADLLEKNRRVPMPRVIQRIAVITSPQAAGWQDFQQQLVDNPWKLAFKLTLFPAAMQGNALQSEVRNALDDIGKRHSEFDVAVLIRGGGSKTDLAWFDHQGVGEAIAHLPIPLLTGIGHDIDETVSDLVAWKSLKTPTAVAAWILDHNLAYEAEILELAEAIRHQSVQKLLLAENHLQHLTQHIIHAGLQQLNQHQWQLRQIKSNLGLWIEQRIQLGNTWLDHAETMIHQLNPATLLKRGYSITTFQGKTITKSNQVPPGSTIHTLLAEGQLISQTVPHEEK